MLGILIFLLSSCPAIGSGDFGAPEGVFSIPLSIMVSTSPPNDTFARGEFYLDSGYSEGSTVLDIKDVMARIAPIDAKSFRVTLQEPVSFVLTDRTKSIAFAERMVSSFRVNWDDPESLSLFFALARGRVAEINDSEKRIGVEQVVDKVGNNHIQSLYQDLNTENLFLPKLKEVTGVSMTLYMDDIGTVDGVDVSHIHLKARPWNPSISTGGTSSSKVELRSVVSVYNSQEPILKRYMMSIARILGFGHTMNKRGWSAPPKKRLNGVLDSNSDASNIVRLPSRCRVAFKN